LKEPNEQNSLETCIDLDRAESGAFDNGFEPNRLGLFFGFSSLKTGLISK